MYVCKKCNKCLMYISQLKQHNESQEDCLHIRTQSQPLFENYLDTHQCTKCKRTFDKKYNLFRHERNTCN